ncbi:MAG: hypothetical protein EBQ96_01500 [Proteobacteria bacterium]|nr:hypothetical protein [Pseudomonadota bacterium]
MSKAKKATQNQPGDLASLQLFLAQQAKQAGVLPCLADAAASTGEEAGIRVVDATKAQRLRLVISGS